MHRHLFSLAIHCTYHSSAPAVKQNSCTPCQKNIIQMCDKCKVDLHDACFKLLQDQRLTMLVFMEMVIFWIFCCSLFQLRHKSAEYGLQLYLYGTVIASRTFVLSYFTWNNHFRNWWRWNALCDCPGPLVPSVPLMEHRNKIKNHMEFLKINEKLGWHSYSNMKQCKINENQAKIKIWAKTG